MRIEPVQFTDDDLAEFRRQECAIRGHTWLVIENAETNPVRVVCRNCDESHAVET